EPELSGVRRRRPAGGARLLRRLRRGARGGGGAVSAAREVFPEWRGKSLDDALTECRELVEDTALPTLARWREAGGKVVGHFQVYSPEEIAHAAGALPFKVRGAPVEPSQAASRFGSYLCSILKTSLDLALTRKLELDLFVTHPI